MHVQQVLDMDTERCLSSRLLTGKLDEKKELIPDIWEKWGRHIWGKGVVTCPLLSVRHARSCISIGVVCP